MGVYWRDEGPVCSQGELVAFEESLGAKLPTSYRSWLKVRDGARPSVPDFAVEGHPEKAFSVQVFFGISREVRSSQLSWNIEAYPGLIDVGWLPIACTDTNDLLLLKIRPPDTARVVFWDSEVPEGAVWEMGVDFDAFVSSFERNEGLQGEK